MEKEKLFIETMVIKTVKDLDIIGERLFSLRVQTLSESQINIINQSIELLNQQHQLFTQYQENKCQL